MPASSCQTDSRYLELWQRMNRVVEQTKDPQEVDHLLADFFLTFPDIDELERHVAIAEEVAAEAEVEPVE